MAASGFCNGRPRRAGQRRLALQLCAGAKATRCGASIAWLHTAYLYSMTTIFYRLMQTALVSR